MQDFEKLELYKQEVRAARDKASQKPERSRARKPGWDSLIRSRGKGAKRKVIAETKYGTRCGQVEEVQPNYYRFIDPPELAGKWNTDLDACAKRLKRFVEEGD